MKIIKKRVRKKKKRNFEAGFFCVLVFQVTFSCLMQFCLYIFLCIHPCSVNSRIVPGIYNLSYVILSNDHIIVFAKKLSALCFHKGLC